MKKTNKNLSMRLYTCTGYVSVAILLVCASWLSFLLKQAKRIND